MARNEAFLRDFLDKGRALHGFGAFFGHTLGVARLTEKIEKGQHQQHGADAKRGAWRKAEHHAMAALLTKPPVGDGAGGNCRSVPC